MSRPARLLAAAVALAALAPAAGAQEPPATPAPPVEAPVLPVAPSVPPEPRHPALDTGWARVLTPGETLRTTPEPTAVAAGSVPSARIAGRASRAALGPDGDVWLRLAFPGDLAGWAPAAAVAGVPPPPGLSPAVRRTLTRAVASLGPDAALVVRDPLGRTLFAAGTRAPLSIASVTKLATVAAALDEGPLPLRTVAAILGPSDNARAQALSNRVGRGSRAMGARRAVEAAAALGAGVRLVDGSGLSPANRASAGEVADLLLGLRDTPRFRTLFRGMPVSARTGTLQWRMAGTAAAGRVRAKTGSLFDPPAASALAGYMWPAGSGLSPERALVMVMLVNRVSPYRARPVQDAAAAALAAPGALTRG